jgi:hypothetical protein
MAEQITEIVVSDPMRIAALSSDILVAGHRGSTTLKMAPDAALRLGPLWVVLEDRDISEAAADYIASLQDPYPALVATPDGASHPGWAFPDIGQRRARRLTRLIGQRFSWHLQPTELSVVGIDGWKRRRDLDLEDWQPRLLSDQTFEQAVESAIGRKIAGSQRRLRTPGWVHEFEVDLPCPQCESIIVVLRALQRLRSGAWRDLYAVICDGCEQVHLHDQLTHDYRRAIEAIAMWSLADDDVAEARPQADRSHSCYVLDLFDPSGKTLTDDLDWVYVGQTSQPIEDRLEQHVSGQLASKWTRRFLVGLNEELTEPYRNAFRSATEAAAYERYLAERLAIVEGLGVKGGH